MRSLVQGNTRFALALLQRFSASPGANLAFSPYSVSAALAMTSAGAAGTTQAEMRAALRLSAGPDRLHEGFGRISEGLNDLGKAGGVQVAVANALWAHKEFPLLPGFRAVVRDSYGARAEAVDFSDPGAAAGLVNAWVARETLGKIRDVLSPEDLGPLTRFVVANAAYFKGTWLSPFDIGSTRPEPFRRPNGTEVPVPLMRQTEAFPFHEEAGLQVLGLPYAGADMSMVLLLPGKAGALADLERALDADRLESLVDKLRPRHVAVLLPRFRVTAPLDLGEHLKGLGMARAFGAGADFSMMTDRPGLSISAVFHKAFVTVDEAGTEAAAATAVVGSLGIRPRDVPVFRADRPFLFLIRDNSDGSILFLGRFADPEGCEAPAPAVAELAAAAVAPAETGPCRYCGKPGRACIDTHDPARPTVYQCAPCAQEHPGFTLHCGCLALAALLLAALAGGWALWRRLSP